VNRSFETYRAIGHRFVTGFLEPEILSVLEVLNSAQRANGISGAVAEIGVHHGKLFIGLHLLQRSGEPSVAIDIFGDQELNVDGSGHGDLQKFIGNVNLWASMDGVVVHQGDSTQLDPEKLSELADSDIRFFSVDGGHTEEIVLSDMKLAEQTLANGGIVIADDVFNEHWPGVSVGTLRYLDGEANLEPFFIGFNKVFFTQRQYCDEYRMLVESAFDRRLRMGVRESIFAGYQIGLLVRRTPVDILRRSEMARSVYHRSYREMVRAMQFVSDRTSSPPDEA
jgi:hypothetical protein